VDCANVYFKRFVWETIANSSNFILKNRPFLESEHENALFLVVGVADDLVLFSYGHFKAVYVDLATSCSDHQPFELCNIIGANNSTDVLNCKVFAYKCFLVGINLSHFSVRRNGKVFTQQFLDLCEHLRLKDSVLEDLKLRIKSLLLSHDVFMSRFQVRDNLVKKQR